MKHPMLRWGLIFILGLLGCLVVFIGAYVIYMQTHYYRIKDYQPLSIRQKLNHSNKLQTNTTYSAATYNVGFGAYNQKFSFFMDTGKMKDGTKHKENTEKLKMKLLFYKIQMVKSIR